MPSRSPIIALGVVVAALSAAGAFDHSLLFAMSIEVPALVLLGWSLGGILPTAPWSERCNAGGLTGLLLAALLLALWMIPSAMDWTKIDGAMRAARIASLVLGVGYALRVSWPLAGALVRWVWHLEAAGMMMRLGVAYLFVDRTLCSGVSSSDQRAAGVVLCVLGIAYLIACNWRFINPRASVTAPGSQRFCSVGESTEHPEPR
jgi:hypothetical protein